MCAVATSTTAWRTATSRPRARRSGSGADRPRPRPPRPCTQCVRRWPSAFLQYISRGGCYCYYITDGWSVFVVCQQTTKTGQHTDTDVLLIACVRKRTRTHTMAPPCHQLTRITQPCLATERCGFSGVALSRRLALPGAWGKSSSRRRSGRPSCTRGDSRTRSPGCRSRSWIAQPLS